MLSAAKFSDTLGPPNVTAHTSRRRIEAIHILAAAEYHVLCMIPEKRVRCRQKVPFDNRPCILLLARGFNTINQSSGDK
jgi:hypothetical protein